MAQALSPQFRPGIIVFVGKESESIRQHIWMLLQSLDIPLRRCIGLIQYESNTAAYAVSAEKELPQGTPVAGTGDFMPIFRQTLSRVQGERGRQSVVDSLSPMPNVQTQIYIVGQAHSGAHELSQALEAILRQLRADVLDTQVCYVLNEFGRVNTGGAGAGTSALGLFDLANFCYLYEEINMRPTFLEARDAEYSAAETLFSLLATGVTAFPGLREALSLRDGLAQYDGHIGGMSTSMVMFPRPHAERYCADLLGAALLRYWRTANSGILSDNERKEQERRAQGVASSIHSWMRESEPRPGTQSDADTKEYRWPNLGILRDRNAVAVNTTVSPVAAGSGGAQPDPHAHARYSMGRRLKEQTERLFSPLSFEMVTEEYRRQQQGNRRLKRRKVNPESWVKIVEHRAVRSEDAFQQWNGQARVAWIGAREKALEQVRATFNELSTTNKNGIELASIYVEELHERLKDVAEELVRWRVRHDEDYTNALSEFDELADGDWVDTSTLGAANGAGTIALHPVAGQVPIAPSNGGPGGGPVIVGGGGPPPLPEFHHMPPREERIARRLGQRVGWHEAQIPALTNIASATVMAAPTLVALSMGLAPSLTTSPLQGIYMAGGIATVGISSGYAYRLYQQNAAVKAKQDLINFYRCYYAHRCESREDVLRSLALSPLMRLVAEMREQLQDMIARLTHVENVLMQDVENTVQELFDGPAAARDIFVANGERLYREGRNRYGQPQYTLAQFAARVEQERLERPVEGFHRTNEDMTANMLHWFDQMGIPILNGRKLSDEDAAARVREFALGITQQYLRGSLVDIGATLGDQEVWDFVLDRVKVPLYRFSAGNANAEFQFVAGCDRHLALSKNFIPTNAQAVRTINTEWLLVSSFFRGNALFGVDPTTLFPFKPGVGVNLGGGGFAGQNGGVNMGGDGFAEKDDGVNLGGDGLVGQNGNVTPPNVDWAEKEDNANRGGGGFAGQNGDVTPPNINWAEKEDPQLLPAANYNWEERSDNSANDYEELSSVDGQLDAYEQKEREYQLPQLQGPPSATSYMLPPSEEEESAPNERTYRAPYLQPRTLNNEASIQAPDLGNSAARDAGGKQQSADKDQAAQQPSVEQSPAEGSQVQPTQPGTLDDRAAKRAAHQAEDDAQGLYNQFAQMLGLPPKPNEPPNP